MTQGTAYFMNASNGAQRHGFHSTGYGFEAINVGIGTTSPASNLHIKTSVDNSVAQGLVIERSANTDRGYINYNGGGFQFRSTVGDPIVFGETDAEHMRIMPDGNVGIGTTAPTHTLQVHTASTGAFINRTTASNAANLAEFSANRSFTIFNRNAGSYLVFGGNGARTDLQATDLASSPTAKIISLNPIGGNVGIGTTSPASKLHIESGNAHNKLSITSTANGGTGYDASIDLLSSAANSEVSINMGINGDADREQIKTYQSAMSFRTNNTERMRIDSSGNLLVGKTVTSLATAGIALMSNNQVRVTTASDNPVEFNRLTNDGDIARFYRDGVIKGAIKACFNLSQRPYNCNCR